MSTKRVAVSIPVRLSVRDTGGGAYSVVGISLRLYARARKVVEAALNARLPPVQAGRTRLRTAAMSLGRLGRRVEHKSLPHDRPQDRQARPAASGRSLR